LFRPRFATIWMISALNFLLIDAALANDFEGLVIIATPQGDIEVALNDLPVKQWIDVESCTLHPALNLKEVVETVMPSLEIHPGAYRFNFIATDAYNVLQKKLNGDFRFLPSYSDLSAGWLINKRTNDSHTSDLQLVWDYEAYLPDFMDVKMMNGGIIEWVDNYVFPFPAWVTVEYAVTESRTRLNLQGLPAIRRQGSPAVELNRIILEADLDEFDPDQCEYAFNFISGAQDGKWNLADHLTGLMELPVWRDWQTNEDLFHGWIQRDGDNGFRVFWSRKTKFSGRFSVKHFEEGTIEILDLP